MAAHALARPLAPKNPSVGKLRRRMEAAIDRLLAALDALDGDPDFELEPDLEEACEDEGTDSDREPDDHELCNWQDEGDQTQLQSLPVTIIKRSQKRRPLQEAVSGFIAARQL